MSTYSQISGLIFSIDSYSLEPLVHKVNSELGDRTTTVFQIHGKGMTGVGEDVTYFVDCQKSLIEAGPVLPLAGTRSFDEFSKLLDTLDYFPDAPETVFGEAFRNYRRWAIESAALDLALQQNNTNLADALSMELKPLTFVASMRLGKPSSFEPIKQRLEKIPSLRFKLDPTNDWTDELIGRIAATGATDTMDFKGFYKGTAMEVKTDPLLYQKIIENFPHAYLEDPDITEETKPLLAPHAARITWDFPIHSLASMNEQIFPIKAVNLKPSRFGPIQELFATYDYCREQGIVMYSGGQTEIGPGRGQVQYLSALFHPDGPNDIAPAIYNSADPSQELPMSPLMLSSKKTGFGLTN